MRNAGTAEGCYVGISDDGNTDSLAVMLLVANPVDLRPSLRRLSDAHERRARRPMYRY